MVRFILAAAVAIVLLWPSALAAQNLAPPPLDGHACADFDSGIWAQSVYEADPAGNPELDPDGDGVACPGLPPGFAPAIWTTTIPESAEPAELLRVVDGDTIKVRFSDGREESVRLILIDTPESVSPSVPDECFGAEASVFTTDVLTNYGGDLYLETDVSDRDRYGRLLRYVWLDLSDSWRVQGRAVAPAVYNVNEVIARAGFASLSTFPPDVRYADEIREAVAFARSNDLGLWSTCGGTDTPLSQPTPNPILALAPEPQPALAPEPAPEQAPPAPPADVAPVAGCDPSYPTLCLQSFPDLDCSEISARRFPVLPPDPHGFDGDRDGVGCESG